MIPGDTVSFTIGRQTAAGFPASGLATADFDVDAFLDGASTSISPTFTSVQTNGGWWEYKMQTTMPATAGRLKITVQPTSGYDIISPSLIEGEIESYDTDTLANLFLTAQGQPGVLSAADSDLGDIVDGDDYISSTLTVPAAKLLPLGQSDLTGLTMEAAALDTPGGTPVTLTCTVVSAAANTLNISWTRSTFASLGTSPNKAWFIDVQAVKAGAPTKVATVLRYKFTMVWQRDTRTS